MTQQNELSEAIKASSKRLGVDPLDLATAMSYETAGTFDPWKKGPTTQWGEHRGLIQWGEPQRQKYGVTQDMPVTAQVEAAERYLKDTGVKPGMGLLDIYSAINAGGVGRYGASDAANGGAPGTVKDKVETQMGAHRSKAAALLGVPDIASADYAPMQVKTVPEQMTEDTAREAAGGPSLGTTIVHAAREDSLTGWILGMDWMKHDDPNYRLDKEELDKLTVGIPRDRWSAFESVGSREQAFATRQQILDQMQRQQELSEAGITGTAARIAAAFGDPIGLGVGFATGGTANAIMWGSKLSRLERVGAAALAGAGVNAGLSAAEEGLKPNSEWDQVLYSAAGGAFLGATFGALSKMPHMAEEAAEIAKGAKKDVEGIEATYSAVPLRPKDSSVGAAQGVEQVPLRQDANDFIRLADEENAPKAAMAPLRLLDSTGAAKKSDNPLTRMLGNALGEEPVGNIDRDIPVNWSASQEQGRLFSVMDTRRAHAIEPHFKAWADARDLGPWEREKLREAFQIEITRARRNLDPTRSFDPEVMKAVKEVAAWLDDYHALGVDPGRAIGLPGQRAPVPGFDPAIPPLPNYMNRVFSYTKLNAALAKFGHGGVADVVAASFRQMQPDIDPKALASISRGYVMVLRKLSRDMHPRAANAMFADDLEGLRGLLQDLPGVDPEAVESVMGHLSRPIDKGSVSRAKHRVMLDEGLRVELPDGTVTTFGELLLEENAGKLMASYNRQMSGQVALAQVRIEKVVDGERHVLVDGLGGPGKLDNMLEKMAAVADDIGQPQSKVRADQRQIEYLHTSTAGVPLYDQSTATAHALRLWREYGLVRVGGQLGFAQAPEIGAIFTAGWKAALAGFPHLRVLLRDVRTGKLKGEFAAEMEAVFGRGAERLRSAGDWQLSTEAEWGTAYETSPLMQKVEKTLGIAKRITMEVSGMNAINTFLHRWSTSAILHWFSRAANGEATTSVQRLRAMGLTDDMAERVFEQMRRHRTLEPGSSFKLARLNLDDWQDLQARAHFERAVHARGRRMVQDNSAGLLLPWMSHPVAQTLLQFRVFVIGAHSKQMLHNIHMWDRESVTTLLGTMLAGMLGHVAQTLAVSPSLSQKQLEDRLSVQSIALGGFQRTGMSALVPLLVDTAMRAVGRKGVFNSRSTDQTSDLWFGNPTTGLIDDVPAAINAIVQPLAQGRAMSKAEVRSVLRPLIWQNTLPVVTLFGLMSKGLPDYAPAAATR
ncbi:hypothetical protein [Ancylobacter amanitiformis]|uniref:Transglycosylase SLT domain-containing protein n=1 Tax=Ancylobacter amanitiformis TaxID=217069 RepID=A0ABU0LPJ4_9HYPH|nr:hypothetical protein [Ancylobacter amanitiformis]MDQ0510626.1 hypothetical protein [Ancylobacter amanitiformis]